MLSIEGHSNTEAVTTATAAAAGARRSHYQQHQLAQTMISAVKVSNAATAGTAELLDRMLCAPPPPPPPPPPPLHSAHQQQNRWLASAIAGHSAAVAHDHGVSTPEAVSNSSSGVSLTLPPAAVCKQQQQQQQHHQQQLQQQQTSLEREWSRRISAGLCPHCDAPAATEEQKHFHERVHAMDELYRCQLCTCRFAYPSSLELHIALHADRGLFLQPPPQQQQQQQRYLQHYPEQQDPMLQQLASYQQQQQQQQYAAAGGKMTLPASHHQQYPQQQQQQQQQSLQQRSPHVCPQCGRGYIRAGNLRNHMLRFHPY